MLFFTLAVALALGPVAWLPAADSLPPLAADIRAVLDVVSADSLRGHVSFLASDLLEGRDTPSRGLDIAAEYIASQFRRAGLEAAGDEGYFQTARFLATQTNPDHFELRLDKAGSSIRLEAGEVVVRAASAVSLERARIFKIDPAAGAPELKTEDIAGHVVFGTAGRGTGRWLRAARALKPALILLLDREGALMDQARSTQLLDPAQPASPVPTIIVRNPAVAELFDSLPAGAGEATATVHAEAPVRRPVILRNVIGVLRGSDPALRDSYVLVSAHYDHMGTKPGGEGDRIYNGANDDASGVATVIELAGALVHLRPHPKRSIVFLAFFGEEEGGYGSRYYAAHPVFPMAQTVADVNLEQLGRTDSTDGPQVATATFTGFDFSDLPATFQAAGERTGIRVYKNERDSDAFFSRSDNQMLANAGIPAHTVVVAYDFPDYHGVGDEWQKIDYDNMVKVDRMLALGLVTLADRPEPPHWNQTNAKTAAYVKAWKRLHAKVD